MTDSEPLTSEEESKAAVIAQYDLVVAQQDEYGWQSKVIDVGDFLVIFVRITKASGRTFLLRLRCDDYPEVAPELRFIDPAEFIGPTMAALPGAQFYPAGDHIVPAGNRGDLPVPCIKGHRDYYRDNWHAGWSNPPAHDHSLYQLVLNVRYAILNVWS